MAQNPVAIVLLSGGLDSATALAVAQSEGYDVAALTFNYGQRHIHEVRAAERVAASRGVEDHVIIKIDLRQFGGSALTADIPVPTNRDASEMASEIPVTYVPARNTIFLAFALAHAEVRGSGDIFIGVNRVDYSGYPDCRPEFVRAFEAMANLATRAAVAGEIPVRIHAPLIDLSKSDIIRRGLELDVDYSETTSCYSPGVGGTACGVCDACQIRLKGFNEAGIDDPIAYMTGQARR
ncbi:MAG: 7-cyano-7-deazaguanine synthase QueC [Alphaproteobacteria bacterium]